VTACAQSRQQAHTVSWDYVISVDVNELSTSNLTLPANVSFEQREGLLIIENGIQKFGCENQPSVE
jgi:hypothetical protein